MLFNLQKITRQTKLLGLPILILIFFLFAAATTNVHAQTYSDSVLDHYWIEHIDNQIVGQEFNVRVTAKDQYGYTYYAYNGVGHLTDFTGISIPVKFNNGDANVAVTIKSYFSNDKVSVDGHGESNEFNVNYSSTFYAGISAGVLVPVVLVVTAVLYLRKRKRSSAPVAPIKIVKPSTPPTLLPTQLKLSADPLTIAADGVSTSVLTLQLLDREDKPVAATTDVLAKLFTSNGKLSKPTITIPKGTSVVKTVITASTERGSVSVLASVEGLRSGEVALNFKEEELHCLYCGSVTTSAYDPCPKCGRIPP